ncbi:MAG: V-type ATP synthase subunit A [Kiritimatiellales bacterium]|nr:V-type ATP synthase subunit A [Kiritimatiellales bacterium]
MSDKPTIIKVAGPLVVAKGMKEAKMYEVCRVSKDNLIGEVIELHGDTASIQVYEETSGVGPGEPVELTGTTLSVDLGPGLLETFYDGIQRPLKLIEEKAQSPYITRGINVPGLDRQRKWDFKATAEVGDKVGEGDVLGTVQETTLIEHRVMVPPSISGTISEIKSGNFNIEEVVAVIDTEDGKKEITMLQKWPIRIPRPTGKKLMPSEPLATGMRVLDMLFPIARGGAAAIPGPFGAGKTVTQQSLAKFCAAQVIVYIGCGERGNEMTEVLKEFPELEDPNTGEPLMKRTVLIANTSNMPVAAREASVYTGITIAEYYRDMGYDVALMADSTSRWAEAMREMSGRLEEMPGEEGYPAYLGSRTAGFYERAGAAECLGSDDRKGSLSVIGAVSPPGGDFSEPVTQNTLRVTKVFWALDAKLTYKRHFPSINWLQSYSLYTDMLGGYYSKEVAEDFSRNRVRASEILQEESKLEEIVRLVGTDSLSPREQLTLEIAKMIREDFLFQNAFDKIDAYTSLKKQYRMMRAILTFMDSALNIIDQEDFDFSKVQQLAVKEDITKCSFLPEEGMEAKFDEIEDKIRSQMNGLKEAGSGISKAAETEVAQAAA